MRIVRFRVRPSVWLTGALVVIGSATGLGERPHSRQLAPATLERQVTEADIPALVSGAEARYGLGTVEFSSAIDRLVFDLLTQGLANSEETLALAERAVRLKRQSYRESDPENATPLENLGRTRNLRGEHKLAIPSFEQACSLREETSADRVPLATCLESMAVALIRTSRYSDAETALNRARDIRSSTTRPEPAALSHTIGLLALLNRWAGRYDRAQALLDEAIATRQDDTAHDRDFVSLLLLKGDLLWLAGDIQRARESYTSATASAPDLLARGNVDSLVALRRQAYAEDALGNSSLAVMLARRAQGIGEIRLAPCHDERASILNDLAVMIENLGDYGTSRDLYERSLSEKRRCSSVNGADIVTPMLNIASVAERMGNYSEAERLYSDVLRNWSERYGPSHPFVALATENIASVALRSGKLAQSRTQWLRVLDMRRRSLGPDHPDVAWTLTNLGEVAAAAGDTAAATRYLDQSLEIYRRTGVADFPDRFARLLGTRKSSASTG